MMSFNVNNVSSKYLNANSVSEDQTRINQEIKFKTDKQTDSSLTRNATTNLESVPKDYINATVPYYEPTPTPTVTTIDPKTHQPNTYNKVQFISANFRTGYYFNGDYPGDKTSAANDITGRLSALKTALNAAYPKASNDSNTMKVFQLPEFFFRDGSGAYNVTQANTALKGIKQITSNSKYDDWTFVIPIVIEGKHNKTTGKTEVWNGAFVIKGGTQPNGKPNPPIFVPKINEASGDFPKRPISATIPGKTLTGGSVNGESGDNTEYASSVSHKPIPTGLSSDVIPAGSNPNSSEPSAGTFTIDNVNFGMEICRDQVLDTMTSPVDIELAPSAGLTHVSKNFSGHSGGYFFKTDGIWAPQIASYLTKVVDGPLNNVVFSPAESIRLNQLPELFASDFAEVDIFKPQPLNKIA